MHSAGTDRIRHTADELIEQSRMLLVSASEMPAWTRDVVAAAEETFTAIMNVTVER